MAMFEPVPNTEFTDGAVKATEGGLLPPGVGVGVGDGLGVGVGDGLGVGVGVGFGAAPKNKPLSTAVLAPVRVTVIFTRPRMFQTRYWPPLNEEIDLVSRLMLVTQSVMSIR